MNFFGEFLLSAVVTIIAYLIVPVIISFAYKRTLPKKNILIITIVNGLVVWILFRIVFALLNDDLPSFSASMAPACFWSVAAYFIMLFFKGHLAKITSVKIELDETVSQNSTPFYVDFIKELKKELPRLSETVRWQDVPQQECSYQIIRDYANSKLKIYTKLNRDQCQNQAQVQQYSKIASDAAAKLQNLKTRREALRDEPEAAQAGESQASLSVLETVRQPPSKAHADAVASSARRPAATTNFGTEHMQATSPFGNAMEALVELGLAKCQHESAAFQLIYRNVKQRLQEDMAETEAQIRHSGKTPKEYVYQMIVGEIDHYQQAGV